MATIIKAGNVASGAQITPDATGILQLNTGSGAGTAAMTIGTDQSVAFAGNLTVDGNTTLGNANTDTILMTAAPSIGGAGLGMGFGFRNRIINGAMVIDQRNAGAAVTTTGAYVVDRWFFNNASDGTLSVQQSTDVPSGSGFKYSLKMTATVGDATIGAAQYCNLQHRVEGYNFADTGFGASGASTVTLSFWVKATVAGNYSVALYNSAENRINPQQFSVLVSNTWEQKTITYTGDTSGTWLSTNGIGVNVTFYPALGSNFLGSAGWNAGGTFGVTGQSNAIASNANIFAITGVQLEKGSTATSFDYRPYGTELVLCQRYFETAFEGLAAATDVIIGSYSASPGGSAGSLWFRQTKRAIPTVTTGAGSTAASTISQNHYCVFGGVNTYARLFTPVTISAEL